MLPATRDLLSLDIDWMTILCKLLILHTIPKCDYVVKNIGVVILEICPSIMLLI